MRPGAAHAPGLPAEVQRLIERAVRRQRKAVAQGLSGRRKKRDEVDEGE